MVNPTVLLNIRQFKHNLQSRKNVNMSKVYIVPIESLDSRYTKQWYEFIPRAIETAAKAAGKEIEIINIEGEQVPPITTPGAFLDFGATNIFKSTQLTVIAEQFQHGKVKPGDKFLFTDAWNPTVISVKYMSELLNIPVELHGMWHAGSYDPQDFLGRLIGNKSWVRHSEKAMYFSYNTNWFATDFHIDMFIKNIFQWPTSSEIDMRAFTAAKEIAVSTEQISQTGWPMSYLFDILKDYSKLSKKKQIVFPHRLAPEKQVEIFKDLAQTLPEYEWIVCQETPLTKDQYHKILGESAIVFSANLQETYGISCIEGAICGAVPLVPDRLSYSEMYTDTFKYPSDWTINFDSYIAHKNEMISLIHATMKNIGTDQMRDNIKKQLRLLERYVHADNLISAMIK